MSYVTSLSAQQQNNLVYLIDEAVDSGIVNPYSIAAFIAIISKESNYYFYVCCICWCYC